MRRMLSVIMLYTFCLPMNARSETGVGAKQVATSASVSELFKALPDSAVHTRIRDRAAVLSASDDERRALQAEHPFWAQHDAQAGILRVTSIGDGEGWREHFKAFTLPTGEAVLLSVSTDWGMCGDQSKVTVWQLGTEGLVEVTAQRWSVPTWTMFNGGRTTSEQHKRIPEYAVFVGEGDDITIGLDQCQFEYPGPLGSLTFDPPLAVESVFRDRLRVTWTNGRFVMTPERTPAAK